MTVEERRDFRKNIACLTVGLIDVEQFDVALCLAVIGRKALRLIARNRRVRVTVVVYDVRPALKPESGWKLHLLAAFQREYWIPLRHIGLGLPVQLVAL